MSNVFILDIKNKITTDAFGKNGKCFLLIDSSLKKYQSDSSLYDFLKNYESYSITFHQSELQGALPLSLFPLDLIKEKDDELFNNSIHHSLNELKSERLDSGEGRSVCAWISTGLTGEQLAEQIALTAVQSIKSVGDILLRYFDPSVLGPLIYVLDSWQKQQLLSNIDTWSYLNGDGVIQIVNGSGECKRKLNYSLGLTESDLEQINRISILNAILRVYRKRNTVDRLNECEAVKLLHPALEYFHSSFSLCNNDVIDFGLDVLLRQSPFYLDEMFGKYLCNTRSKNLQLYSDVKSKIGSENC
ncbi:hypothetical protein J5S76_06750 [Bacillus amyloliquefaciens]|nr:hypothetical protein [Bacillus amyloliquefaciens]